MPNENLSAFDVAAYRARVAAGGGQATGAAMLRDRIALHASDHPVHVAAVDANTLRCEVHALSLADPAVVALRIAAHALDAAADALDNYATAVGV